MSRAVLAAIPMATRLAWDRMAVAVKSVALHSPPISSALLGRHGSKEVTVARFGVLLTESGVLRLKHDKAPRASLRHVQ